MTTASKQAPLLQVEDLTVQFPTPDGLITVVDRVSFTLDANRVLCIVGESGSGKSVTALSLVGLVQSRGGRISAGSVRFAGEELVGRAEKSLNTVRGRDIGFIFQEPMSSLNPAFTVGDQIAEVVRRHRKASRRHAWARAVEMLDRVGIASAAQRAKDYPHHFSGGMRQRVMIALALACDPKLLIADEPTTALDVTIQARTLELLKTLQREQDMGVLFITHDLGVVADIADDVVVMYASQVVEQAPVRELFRRPQHPYTAGLLAAMPQSALENNTPLVGIPGVVPQPHRLPSGCRFHPRCAHAQPGRCTTDPIQLRLLDRGLVRCVRAEELRDPSAAQAEPAPIEGVTAQ
ncbi:ABC transporter ATP-binding protein [Blastococcus mobilis]|uniref:Peptide/nickel transport system ATP-binding protein/oligopeptide transport system ATP-binding protein n=1 Tax=Blastococcus mobilis TaxID=1938746 RepID=A0A238Y1L8_9ACTN|nr:ABC transporter ATP-binding protein [Blastococcus mobilis]SNR65196.1 peptide/nickel transport system ATP-binding protein/oligopeptide transport system ATP-binding protein [Blastococcus mobilis]